MVIVILYNCTKYKEECIKCIKCIIILGYTIDTITSGNGLEAEVKFNRNCIGLASCHYACCGCKLEGDVCLELLTGRSSLYAVNYVCTG